MHVRFAGWRARRCVSAQSVQTAECLYLRTIKPRHYWGFCLWCAKCAKCAKMFFPSGRVSVRAENGGRGGYFVPPPPSVSPALSPWVCKVCMCKFFYIGGFLAHFAHPPPLGSSLVSLSSSCREERGERRETSFGLGVFGWVFDFGMIAVFFCFCADAGHRTKSRKPLPCVWWGGCAPGRWW